MLLPPPSVRNGDLLLMAHQLAGKEYADLTPHQRVALLQLLCNLLHDSVEVSLPPPAVHHATATPLSQQCMPQELPVPPCLAHGSCCRSLSCFVLPLFSNRQGHLALPWKMCSPHWTDTPLMGHMPPNWTCAPSVENVPHNGTCPLLMDICSLDARVPVKGCRCFNLPAKGNLWLVH